MAHIKSQRKVTTKRPLIFITGNKEVNWEQKIKIKKKNGEKKKNPNFPLSCVPVQKLKCTIICAKANERKRGRELQK